jgi:hypothetical protein
VQRLDANPEAMRQRRETVEHPFGTMKARTVAILTTRPAEPGGSSNGDVRVGTILITFGYSTSIVEFDFGPP